jgi:hypothetical protein
MCESPTLYQVIVHQTLVLIRTFVSYSLLPILGTTRGLGTASLFSHAFRLGGPPLNEVLVSQSLCVPELRCSEPDEGRILTVDAQVPGAVLPLFVIQPICFQNERAI